MNAVARKIPGDTMLTNEAIEVHLASLHAGQSELREDVRELRADNKSLRDKIDAVHQHLSTRIDEVNAKIDSVGADLGGRITQLSSEISSMRGLQKALILMVGGFGTLGVVGRIFHWL